MVHGLNCSSSLWNLSFPTGIKPASPALESRFLTAGPPGKSLEVVTLIVLSDDLAEYSLIIHQNSTSGGFSKVSCQLESEITSVASHTQLHQVHGSLWHCNWVCYPGTIFVASYSGHLGNTGPQSRANLPNTDPWHDYAKLKDRIL